MNFRDFRLSFYDIFVSFGFSYHFVNVVKFQALLGGQNKFLKRENIFFYQHFSESALFTQDECKCS